MNKFLLVEELERMLHAQSSDSSRFPPSACISNLLRGGSLNFCGLKSGKFVNGNE